MRAGTSSETRHQFRAVTGAPAGWIPELDGLRGVAVLLVALHHFRPLPWFPETFRAALGFGWVGVDLFFALSGFLITGILLDSRGAANYFRAFYARRALRILPLYLTALAVCFVILPAAGLFRAPDPALAAWYWLHASNWVSAFGWEVPALSHFWSLAIEEQFYLVWPAVVAIAGARRLPWICLALAIASAAARWAWMEHDFAPGFLYRLTPFRVESLAWGALAACAARGGHGSGHGYGCIAVGALVAAASLWGGGPAPYRHPMATAGLTGVALLSAGLVFVLNRQPERAGLLRRALRSAPLRRAGKHSYAIYVVHYPLLDLVSRVAARRFAALDPAMGAALWAGALAAALGATWLLARVSWRWVESPFLRLKPRFVPLRE